MKISLIKVIIIIGICVAIFGAANVKNFLGKGVDFSVNKIEQGVDAIKNSDTVKKAASEVGDTIKGAAGDALNNAKNSISEKISSGISGALNK